MTWILQYTGSSLILLATICKRSFLANLHFSCVPQQLMHVNTKQLNVAYVLFIQVTLSIYVSLIKTKFIYTLYEIWIQNLKKKRKRKMSLQNYGFCKKVIFNFTLRQTLYSDKIRV